nr:alpha/beta fold hydrolase [Legionella jordanis]
MKENTFHFNDLMLNYIEGPRNGPPILLLHGATKRWQSFMPIIEELSQYLHVYAMDFRGHGKSKHTPGAYRLQDYLTDCYSFIKECIQEPAIVLGHSLGGMIAIMLAAHHPQWLQSLVVIDSPLTITSLRNLAVSQAELANRLIQWLRISKLFNLPGLNNHFIPESLSQCDPDMLAAIINEFETTFHSYEVEDLFPKIKCPTLLIRGNSERGSLIRDEDLTKVLQWLPGCNHIKIPHVGHSPIREDRRAVLSVLESFLKQSSI